MTREEAPQRSGEFWPMPHPHLVPPIASTTRVPFSQPHGTVRDPATRLARWHHQHQTDQQPTGLTFFTTMYPALASASAMDLQLAPPSRE